MSNGMSRESIVLVLGVILFIVPHLGVPERWKLYVYTGAGLILVFVGYSLRRSAYLRSIEDTNGEHNADSFVEHNGSRERDRSRDV